MDILTILRAIGVALLVTVVSFAGFPSPPRWFSWLEKHVPFILKVLHVVLLTALVYAVLGRGNFWIAVTTTVLVYAIFQTIELLMNIYFPPAQVVLA